MGAYVCSRVLSGEEKLREEKLVYFLVRWNWNGEVAWYGVRRALRDWKKASER